MATLYVSEFRGVLPDMDGNIPQAVCMPPEAEQTVTISGPSGQSSAFGARTAIIRLISDAVCSVSVGTNPTATTSMLRIAADSPEYFKVAPNQKIAVISNT